MKHERSNTRSPLKDAPLRNPGESTGVEINRLISEDITSYVFLGCLSVFAAVMELMRWYFRSPPSAIVSLFALAACIFAGFKVLHIRRKLRILRQGREGESEKRAA